MLNLTVNSSVCGFYGMFGYVCSFGKFGMFGFMNLFGKIWRSVCSVVFVEKMCISMFESKWKSCAKILNMWWKSWFCTKMLYKFTIFGSEVEKFCYKFYTRLNRGKVGFLHSFHRVYYYYYYLFREMEKGA